jgi:LAO/AO transport system kinase
VINKADRPGSDETRRDLDQMLDLGGTEAWRPPIVSTVATTGEGAGEVWEAIEAHRRHLTDTGGLEARRAQRLRDEVDQIVVETLRARARAGAHDDLDDVHQAVADRRLDPWAAADRLLP